MKMAALGILNSALRIVLLSIWLLTVAGFPLFPYTDVSSTVLPTENNIHAINLPSDINISYYGDVYNTLYIHKDGILGFTRDIQYDQVDWSDKMQTSTYGSSPFIAPFFYNALALQKSAQGYAGHIYYREFNQGIAHTPTLHNLSSYIQATVVGSDHFNAVWGLEVTWANVTSQKEFEDGKCVLSSYSSCKKNTFQVMLLVNETDTYAIINYANLDIEIGKYFQAGFNGGNYRGWTPILPNTHSGHKADVSLLPNNQASDVMGRYIFRISGNNIVRGGCYRHDWYNTLEIYPSYGGMFGGEMIDVAGPCFNQANLICKFGDHRSSKTSIGVYVSTTRMRCPVPMLTERGRIQLSISMNGGATFQYFAHYTVVFPGRLSSSLRVELPSVGNDTWYNQMADTLQIRWDPGLLTNDTSATLDITLFGFMERNNESFYQMLEILGSAPVYQGTYQFHTKDHHCSGDACSQFEVGLVEIKLQSRFTPLSHNALYSAAIPLGWYVNTPLSQMHGGNWPVVMCDKWYEEDRKDMTWIDELPFCPCSLHQALADFGRWQPDVSCNLYSTSSSNCYYHKGAAHCVRAVQPSPQGSGNQCCYGPDGVLRFAADTYQGSTPDRSHDWGAAPYVLPGRVPAMSHWIKDVVTFYYCCLWVDYSKCDHYMDQRPTRDCSGYIPPKAAMVYGYGHIQTFSGTKKYRILTNGDLVLMTALHTVIQGRFEYNPFLRTELWDNSSYSLTSVSVRDYMNSDTAEIRLLGPTAKRNNRRLEVRINGQFIPFDNEALQWQDFRGLAVVDTDTTKTNSNFTILMTNGVGLQVAERNNILSLVVMVPDTFKDNLTGLLGDWYGNLHHYNNTPFTEQSDSIYDQHPNSSYNLQQEWVVILNDSLMYDYKIIGHNIYIPFTSPSIGRNTFCLQSDACNYDFFVSKSYDTANTTLQLESDFQVRTSFLEPVRSCGLLDVPRSIKSNYNYTLGTVTTITGCRTGPLSGNTIYSCESTGNMTQQWTPGVSATCEPQNATTATTVLQRSDVECQATSFKIFVPKNLVPGHGPVTWRDSSCVVYSNGTHFVDNVGLRDCGTTLTLESDSVVFENDLIFHKNGTEVYNGSNIVTYGSDYEFVIPVKCVYPRNSNISTNYIPIVQQIKILERRNGQLDLTMRQYEAEDYNHAVPFNAYPRQVPLNNDIFIRVAMENNVTGLGLSADNCFATSTPSPVDPNWYQLISSGCPVNNAKIHPSGINDVKFSFHAFNFRHNTSGIVYVHCQVSVCLDTDPACVVGCVTRKKRSASVREGTITSNLISTGPFVLTADEGGVAMSTVVAAVSIAVAVIAAVIAIIGWTRKSKKGADS